MNTVKKIITPIFILIMSMTFFMQSVCALCDTSVSNTVTPESVYYGLETTKIYHKSFQFKTSKNKLMSCVVSAYADSNIEVCVYGQPVSGIDTYGNVTFNTNDFSTMDCEYINIPECAFTTQLVGDSVKYTFKNYGTNSDVPLLTMLIQNRSNSRFLNKSVNVFGRIVNINFQDIFTEIADMDNDGIVTLNDAMAVLQLYTDGTLLGGNVPSGKGDMDKDGIITMNDAMDVMNMYTQTLLYN